MATITRENISVLNDKLTVTVNKNDYYPTFEKALNKYSKSANIDGFRKGMVPAGLIKKMYGASIMTEEVIKTVEKEVRQYLTDEKLNIFAQPLPIESDVDRININNPTDYAFHFELGLKPVFEVEPILKAATLTRYVVDVTDMMIDEDIANIQDRFGESITEEIASTEKHILDMQFEETDVDGNSIPNGVIEKYTLEIKDFNEDVQNQFIGTKKGDQIIIDPKKYMDLSKITTIAKGLNINLVDETAPIKYFKLTINEITLHQKAIINEALFTKVYPNETITTEAEFRNKIKEEIQTYWNSQCSKKLYDELYHYLIDNTPITLPETFLKRWLQQGGDKATTPEQAEEAFPSFATQLKWTLISEKLVSANNIEVNIDEVRNHIAQQIVSYYKSMGLNLGTQESWLTGYIDKLMKDRERVDAAYHQLLDIKLFETLGQQINTTEQSITQKDFEKIISEHKH